MVNEIVVSREQGNLSKLDNIFKPESVIRQSPNDRLGIKEAQKIHQ